MSEQRSTSDVILSTVFKLLVILSLLDLHNACEYGATRRAMQCLADINAQGDHSPANLWDYNFTVKACRDGTFMRALNCASRVISSCKQNKEQYTYLSEYLDVDNMRKGVVVFCNNDLKVLKASSACIKLQRGVVRQCASEQLKKYKTKMMASNRDERMQASCNFMDKVFSCQVTTVRTKCGDTPADIFDKLMTHFRLPSCRQKSSSPVNNIASHHKASNYAYMLMIVFVMMRS